jgi:hypothetical protein
LFSGNNRETNVTRAILTHIRELLLLLPSGRCCCDTDKQKRETRGLLLVLNKSVPQGFSNQLEEVEKWRHDCCVTLQSFGPPTGLTLAVVVVISVPF